jgi:acetolactate synthase I/II/III large subunit
MEMTGGEALVAQLVAEGVTHVFGIPGIQLDHGVEALRQRADVIDYVVPRHEQATSYMADGYARTSGGPGVCMVVPGPGVLNALSGMATAYACNSPVLMLAGHIPSSTIGQRLGMLHEINDQEAALGTVTTWTARPRSVAEVPAFVNEAFQRLRSHRRRPVAIELPQDLLASTGHADTFARAMPIVPRTDDAAIADAADAIAMSSLPIVWAGGGVVAADASAALAEFAALAQTPVIMSDNGRGAMSDRDPLALVSLAGRVLLSRADIVIVVGSRFLVSSGLPRSVRSDCRFIYLNIDERDTGAPRAEGIRVVGDLSLSLQALTASLTGVKAPSRHELVAKVRGWCDAQVDGLVPQRDFLLAIRDALPDDGVFVNELTQVGYPAPMGFPVYGPRTFITPGYQGTLGYGFPTALGAAVGARGAPVVSISGDGGFGWGMQDLATLARDGLNVSAVIFRDGSFGNVKRVQQRLFGHNIGVALHNPDFIRLAEAFGLPAVSVDDPVKLRDVLASNVASGGPMVVDVPVADLPSPWHLIHEGTPGHQPPPDPLA